MEESRRNRILLMVKTALTDSDKRVLTKVLPVVAASTALGAGSGYLLKKKLEKSKSLHPTTVYRLGKFLQIAAPLMAGGTAIAIALKNKKIREAIEGDL